ncbi:hypothetical protein AALM74_18460 [Parabacteroides segnis]|uniref:hypothetical protein n=1 Tax=Parabacteroides segnis TaxID=2763058 RepID=UPI003518D522
MAFLVLLRRKGIKKIKAKEEKFADDKKAEMKCMKKGMNGNLLSKVGIPSCPYKAGI